MVQKSGKSFIYVGTAVFFLFNMTTLGFSETYSEAVKADKPISYWRFNQNLDDEMGATVMKFNGPNIVTGPGTSNHALEGALSQIGVDQLYDLASFTYEFWMNPKTQTDPCYLLLRTVQGKQQAVIYNYTAARVEFYQEFDPDRPGADVPNADAWHHLVFSYDYDTGTMSVYLDGKLVDQKIAFLVMGTNDQNFLYIGKAGTGDAFVGNLDEIAIYDKALSAAQVTAHFQSSFPSDYPNKVKADKPLVYYRFENDFKDTMGLYDLSSGLVYAQGPGGKGDYAVKGWLTSMEAYDLYNLSAFTYELWVNTIGHTDKPSYILFRRAGGSQAVIIYQYKPDLIEYFAEFNPRPAATIPTNTDKWHYVVFVYDDSVPEMRVYLDGALTDSRSGTVSSGDGGEFHLGNADNGAAPFDGLYDEVAVYDHVLSEARIQAHFKAPIDVVSVQNWSLY